MCVKLHGVVFKSLSAMYDCFHMSMFSRARDSLRALSVYIIWVCCFASVQADSAQDKVEELGEACMLWIQVCYYVLWLNV